MKMRRWAAAVGVASVVAAIGVNVPAGATTGARTARGTVVLFDIGSKTAGTPFAVKGSFSTNTTGRNKTVVLQRKTGSTWTRIKALGKLHDGTFLVNNVVIAKPAAAVTLRAKLRYRHRTLDLSNLETFKVVGSTPPPPPPNTLLPDLVIRKLNLCSDAERQQTGTCFRIREVNGARQLAFPVTTINAGTGPMEINAVRDSADTGVWSTHQRIYKSDGTFVDQSIPGITYYYAGDGHDHWHILDFDSYKVLAPGGSDAGGVQEKHGYCITDNSTAGGPVLPGTPPDPVYPEQGACGEGNISALAIQDGLSVGYADTYPSGLSSQDIDITGIANGDYLVKVCADRGGYLLESDETNNCASVGITINADDTVTVHDETATGYDG